ncbi:MAG: hypothetical protein AVDCRST_MAG80-1894 [uncultured Rubrobacteraceae bacterium]|uniref:Helix-turn-helix domain-containing protein n=1 Tax=uncultured Rubrobacteraceae bacterium TaxID=349277 RepID=A0A6J4QQ41_9ACTN|nr:MAG: hypothetical protein AVDCRST_MAG80-1894 [uncultured Rubrobacteraceae bacterium]
MTRSVVKLLLLVPMRRYHTLMEGEKDTYTTAEVGRILRRSNRRILQMLETGELEGEKDESGRWRIPQRVVHELLPSRPPRKGTANGTFTARQEFLEVSESAVEIQLRMEALQRELGRLEGRLELTAVAESTLRESLERERERADAERERAEALQLEAERLREQLAEASAPQRSSESLPETTPVEDHRSWWRRFFGFR